MKTTEVIKSVWKYWNIWKPTRLIQCQFPFCSSYKLPAGQQCPFCRNTSFHFPTWPLDLEGSIEQCKSLFFGAKVNKNAYGEDAQTWNLSQVISDNLPGKRAEICNYREDEWGEGLLKPSSKSRTTQVCRHVKWSLLIPSPTWQQNLYSFILFSSFRFLLHKGSVSSCILLIQIM